MTIYLVVQVLVLICIVDSEAFRGIQPTIYRIKSIFNKHRESKYRSSLQEDATDSTSECHQIMYNMYNGGYSVIKSLIEEYKKRTGVELYEYGDYTELRDDPILCKIVQEFGWGKAGYISFATLDPRFKKHWFIKKYDGAEKVAIDYERYRMDTIREMLQDPELTGPVFDRMRIIAHEELDGNIK